MKQFGIVLRTSSILAATTIGAGAFALPYVAAQAGWALAAGYLVVLGVVLYASHVLYAETLEAVGEKQRLVGLVRRYGGEDLFWISCIVVLAGLLVALLAYLLLTSHFLHILFPSLPGASVLIISWFLLSFPILFSLKRFAQFELIGTLLMILVVVMVFFGAQDIEGFLHISPVNLGEFFLPFGPFLFALAGWTAIEPMYEYVKRKGSTISIMKRACAWGTATAIFVYALFMVGILGTAPAITPDALSGFGDSHPGEMILLGIFGIIAIWTSYVAVAREVQKMLQEDLRMSHGLSLGVPLLLPLAFAGAGVMTFFETVSFAGGVFLALNYLFILFVARRALHKKQFSHTAFVLLSAVFSCGILYELVRFVAG